MERARTLRKLLERLAGRPHDPTVAWPVVDAEAPPVDLFRRAVGPLPFGAALADAEVFGRPDQLRWTSRRYCELVYRRAGFQLDFDGGALVYAAFFLGPDACAPPGVRFCVARLSNGAVLSGATTLADVEAAIGEPVARVEDDAERILTYERERLTLEIEAAPSGTLKRLNVFPSGAPVP